MSRYKSKHTGSEIDAAIDRAKAGGAIDTLLSGKAPAGYGLGESNGRDLSNVSLNSLINNGWYYLYRNNTDGPDNVNISDAILFVSSARSDLTKVQRLTLGTQGMQGYELRRVYNNSSWLPWECVNPYMKLGVEYRTTWRYQGKPVYVKAVDCGAMPNKTTKQIEHGVSGCQPFCAYGYAKSGSNCYTLPLLDVIYINANQRKIQIKTTDDYSAWTGIITIMYTKTTD